MREEQEQNYSLVIPANVKTRMEIINGVGISELIKAGIAFGISLVIALIINAFIHNSFVVMSIVFVSTALTIVATMKDKNNQSLVDTMRDMFIFYQNQKFYPYEILERSL